MIRSAVTVPPPLSRNARNATVAVQNGRFPLPQRYIFHLETAHEFADGFKKVVVDVADAVVEARLLRAAENDCRYRLLDNSRPRTVLILVDPWVALAFAVQKYAYDR